MIQSILAATVLLLDNHEDLNSKGWLANIRPAQSEPLMGGRINTASGRPLRCRLLHAKQFWRACRRRCASSAVHPSDGGYPLATDDGLGLTDRDALTPSGKVVPSSGGRNMSWNPEPPEFFTRPSSAQALCLFDQRSAF
jgi:hypothetical protein